jgi:hypothetical protein
MKRVKGIREKGNTVSSNIGHEGFTLRPSLFSLL